MEWINIKQIEKLPESLKDVLFTDGNEVFKGYRVKSSIDEFDFWHSITDRTIENVTHWMPLPVVPKDKE